ncbi:MAG: hypothetical protein ACM3SR_07225, partial [Ignavibacteriales bacterium]
LYQIGVKSMWSDAHSIKLLWHYLVVSQLEDDGMSAVLWFDKLTRNGLAQIPFTLSLSKSVFACLNPIKFRLTDH